MDVGMNLARIEESFRHANTLRRGKPMGVQSDSESGRMILVLRQRGSGEIIGSSVGGIVPGFNFNNINVLLESEGNVLSFFQILSGTMLWIRFFIRGDYKLSFFPKELNCFLLSLPAREMQPAWARVRHWGSRGRMRHLISDRKLQGQDQYDALSNLI